MFAVISTAQCVSLRSGNLARGSTRRAAVPPPVAHPAHQFHRGWLGGWLLLVLLACAACSRPEKAAPTEAQAARAASEEKRYELHGRIIAVNRERGTLTISHEAIAGLMPAMTMEFPVAAGDLDLAKPEQPIRGELVKDGGEFRLEKIWPDDRVAVASVAAAANALRQDTAARGKGAYREVGENLPEFALYDQDGRVVEAKRFRGRQVMLNFIYTRCPVAAMCPAATLRMMAVQKQARAAGVANLELISITLIRPMTLPGC